MSIGDYAQLIFKIKFDRDDIDGNVERMWVLVRERLDGGYLGLLCNEPATPSGEANDLHFGDELPFSPEHVIDVKVGDFESQSRAKALVNGSWE